LQNGHHNWIHTEIWYKMHIYMCNSKNYHNRLVQLQNGHHSWIHIKKPLLMIYNMPHIVTFKHISQLAINIYKAISLGTSCNGPGTLEYHQLRCPKWPQTPQNIPGTYVPQHGIYNVPMTSYHGPQHWTRYMKKWTLNLPSVPEVP